MNSNNFVDLKILEGLEHGDLNRMVHNEVHIDEYKSKMGDDEDIIVVSFKVKSQESAEDLVNFIEKGYDWVLDADASLGELEDGDYVVFVEADRSPKFVDGLLELLSDLDNLTDIKMNQWRIKYHKISGEYPADKQQLENIIPLTMSDYKKFLANKNRDLDKLKTAAGVDVTTRAPKNEFTENLRTAAGLI
jgi:hypothetical protein